MEVRLFLGAISKIRDKSIDKKFLKFKNKNEGVRRLDSPRATGSIEKLRRRRN